MFAVSNGETSSKVAAEAGRRAVQPGDKHALNSELRTRGRSGQRQTGAGNQALLRRLANSGSQQTPSLSRAPVGLQTKLELGRTDDPLELEADQVASQIVGMSAPKTAPAESTTEPCPACAEAGDPDATLRRAAPARSVADPARAPEAGLEQAGGVLRSPGRPLDPAARAIFEPRFGADFSAVRVHTDDQAAQSASRLGARAYATGSQIAFAAGAYQPGTSEGRRLLAHELAHVVQQAGGAGAHTLRRDPETPQGIPDAGPARPPAAAPAPAAKPDAPPCPSQFKPIGNGAKGTAVDDYFDLVATPILFPDKGQSLKAPVPPAKVIWMLAHAYNESFKQSPAGELQSPATDWNLFNLQLDLTKDTPPEEKAPRLEYQCKAPPNPPVKIPNGWPASVERKGVTYYLCIRYIRVMKSAGPLEAANKYLDGIQKKWPKAYAALTDSSKTLADFASGLNAFGGAAPYHDANLLVADLKSAGGFLAKYLGKRAAVMQEALDCERTAGASQDVIDNITNNKQAATTLQAVAASMGAPLVKAARAAAPAPKP